jgi:site-specific recombinase XerD
MPLPNPPIHTLRDALDHYTHVYMPSRNFALHTRRTYADDLRDLLSFLESLGRHAPGEVNLHDLDNYLAHMDRHRLAGATRRRKTYACKSLFAFLHRSEVIPYNPAERMVPPRAEQKEPRVLSKAEYQGLLRACSHHPRDAAILELLLQTGIRLSEVVRLRLGDVALPGRITREAETVGRLHILGKGRKTRWIPLNYKACRALKTWLDLRPIASDVLFTTKFGQPIGPRGIQRLVRKHMSEAGITRACVHTLRHTFATHHVAQGTSLRTVQEVLGHASLKTTSIYVQLAQEAIKRELQEHAL